MRTFCEWNRGKCFLGANEKWCCKKGEGKTCMCQGPTDSMTKSLGNNSSMDSDFKLVELCKYFAL